MRAVILRCPAKPGLVPRQGRIRGDHVRPPGRNQPQVLSGVIQLEVGVQVPTRRFAILAGGKNDEISATVQRSGGQRPFAWLVGIVREIPAEEVDRIRRGILDFDPVLMLEVLIPESTVRIVRKELGDNELRSHRDGEGEQNCEKP